MSEYSSASGTSSSSSDSSGSSSHPTPHTVDLTPLRLAQIKEVFGLFDRSNSGYVHVDDMGSILRSLGLNPSEGDVGDLVASVDVSSLSFPEVLTVLSSLPQVDPEEPELLRAFAVFDKEGNGYIDVENIRYILTKSAEPLLDEEVDLLLEGVETDADGKVNYALFAKRILA